jgi:membrane associated rhomboid family serine protease
MVAVRNPRSDDQKPNLKQQATILAGMIGLLWALELVDQLPIVHLDQFGVIPRQLDGLWGILFAPFLHGGLAHLAANTLPLIFLGWLIMLRSYRDWIIVSVAGVIVGGVGTWLFGGPNTVHIGASGLVFAYFGFILTRAVIERSLRAISAGLVVVMLYGSLIWGVLPLIQGVSWQMHLFGFLGGLLAAWSLPVPRKEALEDNLEDHILFLEADDWESDYY